MAKRTHKRVSTKKSRKAARKSSHLKHESVGMFKAEKRSAKRKAHRGKKRTHKR